MSDKPAVSRVGGRLSLNESAEALVRSLAERHREDPKNVIAEVERGLPLGRLFLRLIDVDVPEVRNGRVSDNATFRARYAVISKAVAQYEESDAKGIARAISAAAQQLGISLSTARAIINGRAGKGGRREGGVARVFWRPLDDVDEAEPPSSTQEPLFKDE